MGLPIKFTLSISVVVIVTSIALTLFFVKSLTTSIRKSLEERCNYLSRNLSFNSEYGVLTSNKEVLSKLTESVVKEDEVVYAVIYDKDGNILSSSGRSQELFKEMTSFKSKSLITVGAMSNISEKKKTTALTFTTKDGEQIHDVISLITIQRAGTREEIGVFDIDLSDGQNEIIGFAEVGISLERMNKQIKEQRAGVIFLTSIVILIGIILSTIFVRIIVNPIKQLVLGTQKIAQGDLDYRVPIKSKDEIGDLAMAFNQMTEDLKQYVLELNKEKDHLLQLKMALEQRTIELEDTLVRMQNIQQELIRSEKFAIIGRLASSVAHELRNPLASLKNISYYLLRIESINDEKVRKMIEMLSIDVSRANKIVTDLLDYSRVKKLNKLPTQIDEFLESLLNTIALPGNIAVKRNFEKIEACIDQDRITQVLINLINNARDAMPNGGEIFISAKNGKDMLEIDLADKGCGMDDETAGRIFEPLFTTKTKGLGLGLAIVKEIITAHGGNITVKSRKGEGTIFEISLPLV